MSSPASTSNAQPPSGVATRSLSTEAQIGLAVCSVLFIFILVTFCIVSRKRELWCFRSDLEAQDQEAEAGGLTNKSVYHRSPASTPRVASPRLTPREREQLRRGSDETLFGYTANVLPDDSEAPPRVLTIPRLVYKPAQKAASMDRR